VALLPWQQAAVLIGITLAVFAPTLSAGFVYDARLQILTDPFLHDPWNWLNVLSFRVMAMDVLDFNRPVNLASLMLDAAVWGLEPFGYHLTSVLLHAVNVVLVWKVGQAFSLSKPANGLARRMAEPVSGRQSEGLSYFLAALVFAVHPVVTEAVCEPTFREDLLVAVFSLGALVLALRHEPGAGGDRGRAIAIAACCLLAVASKESGIAAPLLVAVYWWARREAASRFWQTAIGGGIAVTVAFLAARFLLEPAQSAIFEVKPVYPGGSLTAAMLIEPRILALYAQLFVFPVNLCADYGLNSVQHLPLSVALAILAALAAAAIWTIQADRRMAVAVALVVLPLMPVANLVPIYRAAADRYLYLAMAGVALAIGFLLDSSWLKSRTRLREGCLIACLGAIVLLGMACVERQKAWANPLNLWEDAFRKNPAAYTAASGLGEALREAGRLPEAERATREAIRLSGEKRGDAWATLALILDAQGRTDEAVAAMEKALEADPKLADPAARVKALAMERGYAEEWGRLLRRK